MSVMCWQIFRGASTFDDVLVCCVVLGWFKVLMNLWWLSRGPLAISNVLYIV